MTQVSRIEVSTTMARPETTTSTAGRIATFAYGSMAYMIFLGTFLYAIGFVGDLLVPKSIDSGKPGELLYSLMINAALLSVFALQHTGMARKAFKKFLTRTVPPAMERSTYVLATCGALILMYTFWQPMPTVVWSVENPVGQAAMYGLFGAGWMLVLLSTVMIHHFDLFGMRQVWIHLQGRRYKDLGFRTPGLYRYMRHPIQVGFLIAFWATSTMTLGHLFFAVMTTAYIVIAVKFFEERDLLREFPERYRRYMQQVAGFIPLRKYRDDAA